MRHLTSVLGAVVLASGCGQEDLPATPREAVTAWVAAVNDNDVDRACTITTRVDGECTDQLRRLLSVAGGRLKHPTPASNGRETPGEKSFSVDGRSGATVFVVTVASGDGFLVAPEATILPADR